MIQKHGAVLITENDRFFNDEGEVVVVSVPVKNPWLQIQKESAAIVRAFASEFGLTPSSRTRISVKPPDDDDLARLLAPRRSNGAPT
jgi:P27 family predicted phage terminase small subunit